MKERGQGRPEGAPKEEDRAPQKEQAKPKGEGELSKLLEEKALFRAYAPKGRDPESYSIEAMKQIQSEVTERRDRQWDTAEYLPKDLIQGIQMKALDRIILDKLYSLEESVRKVERAFEIIAYPAWQNQELKKILRKTLCMTPNVMEETR